MQFTDHLFTVEIAGSTYRIRVTASALHLFWGAGVGPQDAEGLVTLNYETIATIAADKAVAGDVTGDEIVVSADDIEG